MLDLTAIVADVRRGMIPAHIYNDPEIFALERDRLFARAWIFVAHESEIPQPGDYVVRRVLADSFIVARDEHSTVRVMFNMCLHRGMQVCRAEMGNASHFRCPYHAWTYRNDGRLSGVPYLKEAYHNELNRERWGLTPVAQLDSYKGLLFATFDPAAPPLREYLGEMTWYLDTFFDRREGGIELIGGIHKWIRRGCRSANVSASFGA